MKEFYTKEDTIFVQIASYRDSELQHTLQDLFKKAKKPENIFVGICHQYDIKEGSDSKFFEIPFPRPKQIRIDNIDYRDSEGCCWARNRVQKLWNGEKWTLVIDSHMRFEEGWDETCVIMAKDLYEKGYKPLITTAVCGYEIGHDLRGHTPNSKVFFDHSGIAKIKGGFAMNLDQPIHHAFFSGGFSFALANIIKDYEYDPYIFFVGEEITTVIRLWTKGYDLFVPHKIITYHLYNPIGVGQQDRNLIWEDNPELKRKDEISRKRVLHIVKGAVSNNDEVVKNIDDYSFGVSRTLRDYERFSGLDFKRRKLREKSKHGIFEEWQNVSNIDAIENIFSKLNS
jgi:hypothetical protein